MSKRNDVDVMALEIGGKIKSLRQDRNYTLQDLTDKTGLSKPLISQIENNRVVPPVATLLKLARALALPSNCSKIFELNPVKKLYGCSVFNIYPFIIHHYCRWITEI